MGDVEHSEGATVQLGKPMPTGIKTSSLLYNEYVVYSLDQVQVRYLVQLVCRRSTQHKAHTSTQKPQRSRYTQGFHFKPSAP